MEHEKKIILLAGPTACGKSKLALRIAKHINGEIINADSMQVYKEISILTSKPTAEETKFINHRCDFYIYSFSYICLHKLC